MFFLTVQAKTGLTGFPNRSDRFRPVGCREGFFEQGILCSSMASFYSDVERLLRCFGSHGSFGEFLDKIGLTGLPNQSDRFPLSV
jgi:hypothetical protein